MFLLFSQLDEETILKMMEMMIRVEVMDKILEDVQRHGRYSFYTRAAGEEAMHIGSSQALTLVWNSDSHRDHDSRTVIQSINHES
jgi:TPP-dependent pyruvate/acetoin dehydrogenase alpha subunit